MNDILQYKDFAKIEPVNKGWSVPWAISVGLVELNTMLKLASDMLDYYDGMTNVVPK